MCSRSAEKTTTARRADRHRFRVRLTLLTMATASVALVLASTGIGIYDLVSTRSSIEEQVATAADNIATSAPAALLFDDADSATEDLAILRNQPHVTAACLYGEDKKPFAVYTRSQEPEGTFPEVPGEPGTVFAEGYMVLFRDVVLGGESIGALYIKRDLLDITQRLRRYTLIIVIVFLISLGVAMVSTSHFQGMLVRPIRELVDTAAAVSRNQDYSVRARKLTHDELGILTDAFNQMIEGIQKRDREREELIAELEAKNAELERFTYTVSHDLKNPLVTIRGFLGLLAKDAASGDAGRMRGDIEQIRNATETMHRLLEELLELSRIGRIANPSERLHLRDLAREAVDLLQGVIRERKIHVEIAAAADMPSVLVDRPRLREVLQNLIENAVKFMGEQPRPRIDVAIRRNGYELICSVRDNGRGIDTRYHEKIFGLFERLDPRTDGTGVGLALVKRIVEFHGGRVWVDSEGPGRGSTFYFTLPVE
ncbi:MAG: HAMP domain-containing protein, partial [bacterium]|nr:HAMP domain-containing protein [bacterium]